MLRYLLPLMVATTSASTYADTLIKDEIPEAVLASLYQKHPNALDITAQPKKHFNQDLYLVFFKEGDEKLIELYRVKGPFYVNGAVIEASGLVPDVTFQNLKSAFNEYEIKQTILVVNPNGPGEEYDMILLSAGQEWSVSLDANGNIVSKEP